VKYKLITENDNSIMIDILPNIIGYLYNRNLIDLPDEYWIEEDNSWKSFWRKDYKKILKDFEKLTKNKYKLEKYIRVRK